MSFTALFLLLLHFPCSVASKFLFTILNFYTYKSTSLPQAPIPVFKIEFWVLTAIGTAAPIPVSQRDAEALLGKGLANCSAN